MKSKIRELSKIPVKQGKGHGGRLEIGRGGEAENEQEGGKEQEIEYE